jgi:hypothetical protein
MIITFLADGLFKGFPSKVVNVDITLPPPKKAVVKLYEPFQLYYRFFGRW